MAELRRSESYRILDREQAELKALQLESARNRAKKDQAITIAKALLIQGIDKKIVQESTGLTMKQVERLAKQVV